MAEKQKNNRRLMYGGIALVLVLAVLVIWVSIDPDALTAPIDLTVTVVHSDDVEEVYKIRTKEDTLAAALEDAGLISGVYVDADDNLVARETVDALKEQAEAEEEPDVLPTVAPDTTPPPEEFVYLPQEEDEESAPTAAEQLEDIHYRISVVAGEYADLETEQYWLCYQNDTRNTTAADEIEIADEDEIRLTFYQAETADTAE